MPCQIVINTCYGGFGLSPEAVSMYEEFTKDVPKNKHWCADEDIRRDDPILIRIIQELGLQQAAGQHAKLQIIEIPDDVPENGWIIQDYDGIEWVAGRVHYKFLK